MKINNLAESGNLEFSKPENDHKSYVKYFDSDSMFFDIKTIWDTLELTGEMNLNGLLVDIEPKDRIMIPTELFEIVLPIKDWNFEMFFNLFYSYWENLYNMSIGFQEVGISLVRTKRNISISYVIYETNAFRALEIAKSFKTSMVWDSKYEVIIHV